MDTGIIQIQMFAPRFVGCPPEIINLFFALDENGNDRLFTKEEYDKIFKAYPYAFVDGAYTHQFKVNGYDCWTKYMFVEQKN